MKIILEEGPQIIRTDEGDIGRGVPAEVSDALGEKLLANEVYKFTKIEEAEKKSVFGKKKGGNKNGTD
jgi:hypothetical protein